MQINAGDNSIVKRIRFLTKTNSNTFSDADIIAEVNLALESYLSIVAGASYRHQFDDTNLAGLPIFNFDVASGSNTIDIKTDASGNDIVETYRFLITDSNGDIHDLKPFDSTDRNAGPYRREETESGLPTHYDKAGKKIILYPTPNYTRTGALKVYGLRDVDRFLVSDTTKEPGIPKYHHEYLTLKPAYYYSMKEGKGQANVLKQELMEFEERITDDIARADIDDPVRIKAEFWYNDSR